MLREVIGGLLEAAGLGVDGVDILPLMPDQPDRATAIVQYPGQPPVHTKTALALERPRFQVTCRARSFPEAREMAHTAYRTLSGYLGTLEGVTYSIRALQDPFPLPTDDNGRNYWTLNLEVLKGVMPVM